MERRNGVASTNHNNNRRRRYFTQYIPLHKAALKGDWEEAEKLLRDDTLVRARITEGGLTALHIAAIEGKYYFVYKLIQRMDLPSDLEITSNNGVNALCFAAAAGNITIVKLMHHRHPGLASMHGVGGGGDSDGVDRGHSDGGGGGDGDGDDDSDAGSGFGTITPLSMAALLGHHEMSEYLYDLSDFHSWDQNDQVSLLTRCISTGMYGLAMKIVDQHRNLVAVANYDKETPLEILAHTPAVFSRRSDCIKSVFWETTAKIISPFMKVNTHKLKSDAYMLFDHLWEYAVERMCQEYDIEAAEETAIISTKLLFIAAESGNDEFLVEIISRYPDFLYTMNSSNHSIFHIAVLNRNVRVFNLIYELNGTRVITAGYIDKDGNNMLHLAAKLAPQERLNAIPGGAALQMQQELMWFKEVEKIVPPSYRTMKNSENQTPHELFSLTHEKLMSEGEKQLKRAAKSFMLVTMLIPALSLAIAGMFQNNSGNNRNYGTHIRHPTDDFASVDFQITLAVSLLSSLMSMLMFLHVMTSRCNDKYFLISPLCLVCGVLALSLSIGSMIVVFGTCPLFGGGGIAHVLLLMLLVVVVPLMMTVLGPLLFTILRSTFSSHLLFGSSNRLFS